MQKNMIQILKKLLKAQKILDLRFKKHQIELAVKEKKGKKVKN